MENQEILNFSRIAEAIGFIQQNFRQQPDLDEIAEKIHLSPSHLRADKNYVSYLSII